MTLTQGLFEPAGGLQEVVDRQETMLREVNHRAKNSVAMAIGLLRIQKQRSPAMRVKEALEQAIQRLHHLARIHDILSRQETNGSDLIDMPTYLAELCDSFSALVVQNVQIRLRADPLQLEASRVAPVALIVGEAISNALKHAFPRGTRGIVDVAFSGDANSAALVVEDNGVGAKEKAREGSLGVRLMTEMARSLGGELIIESDETGTRVSTSFLLSTSTPSYASGEDAVRQQRGALD